MGKPEAKNYDGPVWKNIRGFAGDDVALAAYELNARLDAMGAADSMDRATIKEPQPFCNVASAPIIFNDRWVSHVEPIVLPITGFH